MSDFSEAWAGLKRGEKWRRPHWAHARFITREADGEVRWSDGWPASFGPNDIDATDWERVDERPTMNWAEACQAMLDRKVVERGFIRIRLNAEDQLIQDDEDGAPYPVTRDDLKATDWRKVRR